MRGLRDVARISGAKGADLRAICATKEGMRLAQSIFRQVFDQIGFFSEFSRLLEADSEARKKRDPRGCFGSLKGVVFAGWRECLEVLCAHSLVPVMPGLVPRLSGSLEV
jgi:hypothetical protein